MLNECDWICSVDDSTHALCFIAHYLIRDFEGAYIFPVKHEAKCNEILIKFCFVKSLDKHPNNTEPSEPTQ